MTMKKSYLAAAAILGAAIFAGEAHAVEINLGGGKSFEMGFRAKIHGTWAGKRDAYDKSDLILSVPNSRIYGKGSISQIFKWGLEGDFAGGDTFKIPDTFVTLDFAKELKVYAGWIKLPWELHSGIQSGWSFVMPTGPAYGLAANPFTNPDVNRAPGSSANSLQLGIWGNVADGMFKYYLYLTDAVNETNTNRTKTGYGVRVEFAPTMAGYKGHPGYVPSETYLGKQNTLTIGLSYYTRKIDKDLGGPITTTVTAKSFGIDAMWEQNLGAITPNISLGYVDHKHFRGDTELPPPQRNLGLSDDRKGIIVQGQVLFNQETILGKPAIGLRWAQSDPDTQNSGKKSNVLGATAQLYVSGVGNRIALAVDRVTNDAPGAKDYTDVTLAFWYNF